MGDDAVVTKPPRRWLPIILGALTFVIVLAGLGAVVGDWALRNAEMRSLITQVEESEAAMGALQQGVQDVAAAYESKLPLDDQEQAALDTELETLASQARDAIGAAGDDVAGVRWLLWHREIGAAQEAYLAHNRAWQAYLARAAEDPAEFGRQQDLVNTTFVEAESSVRFAVPVAPLFDIDQRVDAIFAPPPMPEGSGQQA